MFEVIFIKDNIMGVIHFSSCWVEKTVVMESFLIS